MSSDNINMATQGNQIIELNYRFYSNGVVPSDPDLDTIPIDRNTFSLLKSKLMNDYWENHIDNSGPECLINGCVVQLYEEDAYSEWDKCGSVTLRAEKSNISGLEDLLKKLGLPKPHAESI